MCIVCANILYRIANKKLNDEENKMLQAIQIGSDNPFFAPIVIIVHQTLAKHLSDNNNPFIIIKATESLFIIIKFGSLAAVGAKRDLACENACITNIRTMYCFFNKNWTDFDSSPFRLINRALAAVSNPEPRSTLQF